MKSTQPKSADEIQWAKKVGEITDVDGVIWLNVGPLEITDVQNPRSPET